MSGDLLPFHLFDPKRDHVVVRRRLPHWAQAGTLCFITWRTWDSMPKHVLAGWLSERQGWLRRHGIEPHRPNWRALLRQLPRRRQAEFLRTFGGRWQEELDACHGSCVLRRPEVASIVAESLRHFDNERYRLTDFVVMPSHVHVLVAFPDEEGMLKQCRLWKQFTATRINRGLDRRGRFWQQDGFDHLVRSEAQLEHFRQYIAENPGMAGLGPGQFVHYSRPLGNIPSPSV